MKKDEWSKVKEFVLEPSPDNIHFFCVIYKEADITSQADMHIMRRNDRIVVMSNGGFGGIHDKLLAALERRHG